VTGWLAGHRALVVGAGSGIGRAVVDAYLAEGAQVAVLERDPGKCAALEQELTGVTVVQGDATTPAADAAAVGAAVTAFGGLDGLVVCVGVFDQYLGIRDLPDDAVDAAFDEVFSVNVRSCLHAVRAAVPHLERARGVITLTTSTSAHYPGRGGVLYVSSKFAVRGLVTALAHELAPAVRVNAVAPGGTLGTDFRGAGSLGLAEVRLDDAPGRAEAMRARTPLAVALTARDHTGAYVYLASDRARGVTGTVLHSDGGMAVR
jgi:NAD(P)-dependent dehydrogenase (short-subunit alcohol dehydrogenase family)